MRILITGVARAIGAATAEELAALGYEVIATAWDALLLDGLDVAMRMPLDVTDEASIDEALCHSGPGTSMPCRQQCRHLREGAHGGLPHRSAARLLCSRPIRSGPSASCSGSFPGGGAGEAGSSST